MAFAAGVAEAALDAKLDTPTLRPLSRAFANSVAVSLPVPAASAGVTFTFDPATSAFERATDIAGQIFLEPARPIGRGRLNVSFTYQYVRLDSIDGHSLHSLSDTGPPIVDTESGHAFTVPHLDLNLVSHEVTTSITYGVTTDLEVNFTLPFLQSQLETHALLHDVTDGHTQTDSVSDAELGPGAIFLRGKYRLLHGWAGDVAAGLVLRIPTGNQHDFQDTGTFGLSPLVYASTASVALAPGVRVAAHLNAGLDLVPEASSQGAGRYGLGLDCTLGERATLSIAFLGREPFGRLVPPGSFDLLRTNGTRAPIFGLSPGRPSYYDLSIGARVALWHDTVFGVANVLVPVNQQGVRASVIPLIGLEAAF